MKMKNRVIHTFRFRNNKLEHYSDDMTFQDVLAHNDDQIFRSLTDDTIINDCDGNEISIDGNFEVGRLRLDNNEWVCKHFDALTDTDLSVMEKSLEDDFLKCYDIPNDEELCNLIGLKLTTNDSFIATLREDYVRENFVPNKEEVSHA